MPDVPELEPDPSTSPGVGIDRLEIDPHEGGHGVAVGPGRGAGAVDPASRPVEAPDPPPLTSAEYSVAFSPRNLAIGLAVLAGVVAFVASRRRGRSSGHDEVR
jgi:hypothetical protein